MYIENYTMSVPNFVAEAKNCGVELIDIDYKLLDNVFGNYESNIGKSFIIPLSLMTDKFNIVRSHISNYIHSSKVPSYRYFTFYGMQEVIDRSMKLLGYNNSLEPSVRLFICGGISFEQNINNFFKTFNKDTGKSINIFIVFTSDN